MEPVPEILRRDIEDQHLDKVLATLSLGLERTIDFGTYLLKWFAEQPSTEKHRIVFAMLLRNFLELLDATSILVRKSSIDPCKLILRSMVEIFFSLEYMLEEDTENRASAFIVSYIQNLLKEYRKMDPSTPQGQDYLRKMTLNQRFPIGQTSYNPEWSTNIAMLKAELALPVHEAARSEYMRLKAKGNSKLPWYSFFDGPHNIEQLATKIKLSALYETHYRLWSGPIHGTDIFSEKLFPDTQGRINIVQIRYVKDAQLVCANAFTISAGFFHCFVETLVPERKEESKNWFNTIYEYGARITGPDFINVTIKPIITKDPPP